MSRSRHTTCKKDVRALRLWANVCGCGVKGPPDWPRCAYVSGEKTIALGVPCERREKDETSSEGMGEGREGRKEGGVEGSAFAWRKRTKPMHMLLTRTVRICACIACRALLCMFLSRRSLGFDPARASAPCFPDGPRRARGRSTTRTLGRSCGPPARPRAAALAAFRWARSGCSLWTAATGAEGLCSRDATIAGPWR